jgi:molybdopterin/thiamine biosynthesis adenylyltransferase
MNQEEKSLASSRPFGVANELGATELNAATVYAKRVVLTGERLALSTRNGQWCFLDSLRLLSRVVGVLEVAIPEGLPELERDVDILVPELWSQGTVCRVQPEQASFDSATAILNVGSEVHPHLPWTSILANGWVARCTSGATALSMPTDQDNPVSCMLAASFGVTEVFKRVYSVPTSVAAPTEDVAFSLFELDSVFNGYGPALPGSISLPSTLVLGAGAIGNGLVLLLSQLALHGSVLLMDKQNFGTENYGTCTLLDFAEWIGKPKANMLADWLRSNSALEVQGEKSTIEGALNEHGSNPPVDLVINGLDDVGARRAVQKLWPSLLVDGAINSAGAAVVTYSTNHRELACLRCTFPDSDGDAGAMQAKATGLHRSSLKGDHNRLITDDDIAMADEPRREWLREQQREGQTVCSTITNGITAERLGLKLEKNFRPSVPFVATASAALVIAQVLRTLLWPEQKFVHQFQFPSLFVAPGTGVRVRRFASPDCECTKNSTLIDTIIARRKERRAC